MTTQKEIYPETKLETQRMKSPKIRDVHTVIIETTLWKPSQNTLLTVYSSLHKNPIRQYGTFRSIYEAVRYYREQYELAGFEVSPVKMYHVHADMFTAEFNATH